MELSTYLISAIILYGVGTYCLLCKRNLIRLFIGLEILANAANLNLIAFSLYKSPGLIDPLPHSLVMTAIVIDGCVIGVGLALILAVYKKYGSLDVRELRRLRW